MSGQLKGKVLYLRIKLKQWLDKNIRFYCSMYICIYMPYIYFDMVFFLFGRGDKVGNVFK